MSALDVINFFKRIIPMYCIGGDIEMLNNMRLRTPRDVEIWLAKVKSLVGERNYQRMKKEFQESIQIDFGFKTWDPSKENIKELETMVDDF